MIQSDFGKWTMIIPDRFSRTVRLPVRFKAGRWLLPDGAPLPELREGTCAELILPAYALSEAGQRARWTADRRHTLFPAETSLWAGVRGRHGESIAAAGCVGKMAWPGQRISVVEVRLRKALELIVRPGKRGLLDDCPCWIPALGVEARSVNEAYSLISRAYETHRRSHSGNVFHRVFFADGEHLRPLESRRIGVESDDQRGSGA